MKLRYYQEDIYQQIINSSDDVIIQLDTGAGKTPIIADVAKHAKHFIVIAHRIVLVEQASKTLSKMGVAHNVMASKMTRGRCSIFARNVGIDLIKSKSRFVASIDTLFSKKKRKALQIDINQKYWVIIDEAHHALDDNKWSALCDVLPNARFIGFTATPKRNDGRSLNSLNGGLFDRIIQAKKLKNNSTRILIEEGYLSDYELYTKSYSALDLYDEDEEINISSDVFEMYKLYASDKTTLVSCMHIEHAVFMRDYFIERGISAGCIHSKMPSSESNSILNDYRDGHFKVLCQVEMIGEGFDMPEIEVLIILKKIGHMAFKQLCGRVLRPHSNKEKSIILDFAGNALNHGLPDDPINWNIESGRNIDKNIVNCNYCGFVFYLDDLKCPKCGAEVDDLRGLSRYVPELKIKKLYELIRYKKYERDIEIAKIKENDDLNYRLHNEIIYPVSTTNKTFEKILIWFCEVISQEKSFAEVNSFLRSHDYSKMIYKNFTVIDVVKNDRKKAIRIYDNETNSY